MTQSTQNSEVLREVEAAIREAQQTAQEAARDAAANAREAAAAAREDAANARQDAAMARLGDLQVTRSGDGTRIITLPGANGEPVRIVVGPNGTVVTGDQVSLTGAAVQAPTASRRKQLPEGLVDMMMVIFGFVAVTSIGTPLAKAFAKRWERKGEREQQLHLAQRLEAIEQAIETVAVEVERISEGQRFTSKLLAERAPSEMERVR
ncbi:MAG: hypothetical protein C0516_12225 [Gemmatimonas sp.]|nr:hypothetical protein [Gemmatimonas sp.]